MASRLKHCKTYLSKLYIEYNVNASVNLFAQKASLGVLHIVGAQ